MPHHTPLISMIVVGLVLAFAFGALDDALTLKGRGAETIIGNAADPEVIKASNLEAARCLLVAIPDAFEGGQVVEQARAINPGLTIIARSHSEAETEHLLKHCASQVVMGEHEIAKTMITAIPRPDSAGG